MNIRTLEIMIEMAGSCYASACYDPLQEDETKEGRRRQQRFWKSLRKRMLKASADWRVKKWGFN